MCVLEFSLVRMGAIDVCIILATDGSVKLLMKYGVQLCFYDGTHGMGKSMQVVELCVRHKDKFSGEFGKVVAHLYIVIYFHFIRFIHVILFFFILLFHIFCQFRSDHRKSLQSPHKSLQSPHMQVFAITTRVFTSPHITRLKLTEKICR